MEVSALELSLIVKEMGILIGCVVDNVYQLEDSSIVIKLRCKDGSYELRASAGHCVYFTSKSYPKPKVPTSFAMRLRKLLNGLRLEAIEQLNNERIAIFRFNERRKLSLVVELLPRGNIVLLDDLGKILISLFSSKMKDREIAPGKQYVPPPQRFSLMDEDELSNLIAESLSLNRKVISWLTSNLGLSPKYAEEVLALSGIDGGVLVKDLDEDSRARLIDAITKILSYFKNPCPMIAKKDSEIKAVPFHMESIRRKGYEFTPAKSFNEAIALEYEAWVSVEVTKSVRDEIRKKIDDLSKELDAKRRVVQELEAKIDALRKLTDAVFPMLNELEEFRKRFLETKLAPPYPFKLVEYLPDKRIVKLSINDLTLDISLDNSVSKQLEILYEEMKKIKKTRSTILNEIEMIEGEILSLEKRLSTLELPVPRLEEEERPVKWYEKFRWFNTSAGLLAVGGKDAQSNITLLKKYLEPNDLVFHTEIAGSPAVILKGGRSADEQSLQEVADFTASYSRAWKEGLSSVSVFYVTPEQISFTPPSGQYLPKGSFIVKGKRNYLKAKICLAFGLILYNDQPDIVFGPLESVMARTSNVVKVVPGKKDARTLSKMILEKLLSTSSIKLEDEHRKLLEEKIVPLIPYGKGEIVDCD